MTKEIKIRNLDPKTFIKDKVAELKAAMGKGIAINALSGGVDSSAVTMLGHKALGANLKTYFIDSGLMREGEPQYVQSVFKNLGVPVEILEAQDEFFNALKGLEDPEDKRNAITHAFYKTVFGPLVKETGAEFLLHGTNYTDVEETVAGIKRQHNILEQLGINPEETFGYKVLEPLVELRKTGVRMVAKELGLPEEIFNRPPFPGPALSARVVGEVTRERVATVRAATVIVEDELQDSGAFQYLAIIHEDRVTGIRDGKREFGKQVEVRCWESTDAVTATPTHLSFKKLETLGRRISEEVPGVVSVTYNITPKPPSTIEPV